eukprot:15467230-Alexandrium_andersonii.AAC.2
MLTYMAIRQPFVRPALWPERHSGAAKGGAAWPDWPTESFQGPEGPVNKEKRQEEDKPCLLYTSDAADDM